MSLSHFELSCILRGVNGEGPGGWGSGELDPIQRVLVGRTDRAWAVRERSFREHIWATAASNHTAAWVRVLVQMANYLSDLIGGDIAVLAPRDLVEASAGLHPNSDQQALLMGRAIQRAIAANVERSVVIANELVLEEIRRLLDHTPAPVPTAARWLDTKALAARLSLDEITVARLCRKGLITAEKTGGGQWRATADMLRRSPYLNGQTRRKRGKGNGQLE